jgi:TetR/AcrR family transcriptional regulator, mexJK operon transcriptional repressor
VNDTEDPRITRSRELILRAAATVFLERGYSATTVDGIAAVAGVAKRTVYNLYADKDALFRATVLESIATADRFSNSLADTVRAVSDPGGELPAMGVRLAESVLLGPVLPLRRLLIMESGRFPELASEYRDRAPEAVMRAIAELFAGLMAEGLLRRAEPALAAEHFAFLVMGADLDRGMFEQRPLGRSRVRARARAGADAFLRAYAP